MKTIPRTFIDQYQSALHVICTDPRKKERPALQYVNYKAQVQEACDAYIAIQVHEILDSSVPTGLIHCDQIKDKKIDNLDIGTDINYPHLEQTIPKTERTAMLNVGIGTLEKLVKYMKKAKLDTVDIFKHHDNMAAYTLEFRDAPHVTGLIMPCRTDKELNPVPLKKEEIKSEDLPF